MMPLPDIREAQIDGKTILLRADLNVPFKGGVIADHSRIHRAAATINALLARGARIVVMAHLDRPRGVANPVMSMAPVAGALADELNRDVRFVPDCVGAGAERWTRSLPGSMRNARPRQFRRSPPCGRCSWIRVRGSLAHRVGSCGWNGLHGGRGWCAWACNGFVLPSIGQGMHGSGCHELPCMH